ncbi:MAG TPA: hypothetical protein VG733_06545, partial [Chthoniobacteraceae bacterium]|nr:hypothetical protein [Chthoniobacteraceae bacterium]
MAFAVCAFAFFATLHASGQALPPSASAVAPAQSEAEITKLLTTGQWYFQGQNWSNLRIFKADGTFITLNRNNGENGAWKVADGAILLIYASSQDKIMLPLRPEGCRGQDRKGHPIVVMQRDGDATIPAPPEAIKPEVIEAGKASKQTEAEVKALLTDGRWFCQGQSWSNTRVFTAGGTYKGGGDGLWKMDAANGMVDLGDDKLILPVDPKGTIGIDAHGLPFVAVHQPLPNPAPPEKMADRNIVNTSAQTDAAIKELLVKGQWRFQGESWENVRVFKPDGTFYTQRRAGEGGTWKIISGMVVLSFKSTENTILLPVDPEGTVGKDSELRPMIVFQEPLDPTAPVPNDTPIAANP